MAERSQKKGRYEARNRFEWVRMYGSNVISCETPQDTYVDERHAVSSVTSTGVHDCSDGRIAVIPERFRHRFMALCWTLLVVVWLSAVMGPVYVLYAVCTGAWDSLVDFLCIWLVAGLLKFPRVPRFADLVSSGIECWFKRFSISYEDRGRILEPAVLSASAKRRPTIYCYHPHGLLSIGTGLLAADLVRRGEKVAIVTSAHMRWFNPVLKILLDMAGIEVCGSSPKDVQAAMKRGDTSLILVPGGYEEAVMTEEGFERLYLKDRMGFVKYAMRYGYSLTPVFAYGENDLYSCVSFADKVRGYLAAWKIPVVLFYGDKSAPFMPKRTEPGLNIVVGEPVLVEQKVQPDGDSLRFNHGLYVHSLVELYYRHNRDVDRPLEIY